MRKELTTQQHRAIACLLTSKDIKSAARAAGVSYRSLTTWLDEPNFSAVYFKAKSKVIDGISNQIIASSTRATAFLSSILDNEEAPYAAKVRAAIALNTLTFGNILDKNDAAIARSEEADPSQSSFYYSDLQDASIKARERIKAAFEAEQERIRIVKQVEQFNNQI